MDYNRQIERVVDYIKAGEKERKDFTIGVEMEHFVVEKDDLHTVSYYGERGVGETLEELTHDGFKAYKEGEYVLGLEKDKITVSTEPGSQFEIAIESKCCVRKLEKEYINFFKMFLPILDEKNQMLVPLGYHPNMKIDDIKILPKERYGHMYRYFKTNGTMSHNMMKGTSSLQVTVDFENEDDFKKKYRVLNALSPVMYAMFDNAYIFEKEPLEEYNIRQKIWENTDPDRSGVFEISMDKDMSYKKYAEKILNTPIIFDEIDKETVYTGGKLFKDIFDPEKDGDEKIFHALSIVFPDIRVKRYIEIRMMDAVKYPLNFSCVALVKGLIYYDKNLDKLNEMFKDIEFEDIQKAKIETKKKGLQGEYKGEKIVNIAKKIVDMAEEVLEDEEKPYLEPLKNLMKEEKSPRDKFKEIYDRDGLEKAVKESALSLEELDV